MNPINKILAITILSLFAFSSIGAQGYKVGDQATDFHLKNIDGNMVSLSNYKYAKGEIPAAKGFIVIFTCNHCPYSIAYENRIIALDKKYKPLGYPVIA